MKGKGRPELSWEVCSPKISILPPVYIKKRGKINRGIVNIERETDRQTENTNLMMRKDPCPWRKRRANCIPIEDESRSSNTKISWWEGSLSFFFCTHLQNQSTKSKIGSKRERKPSKQRALNQNETLAADLATISGPEVTHQAVDFRFGGRNLVRWTWGLGFIVINIGLVSNRNNLWALLWAFAYLNF